MGGQVIQSQEAGQQERLEVPIEQFSGYEKDVIVDAARNIDLTDSKLEEFLSENLEIEITPEIMTQLVAQVESQRIDDLISYLNSNMMRKDESMDDSKSVRIRTPRGYLRKIFSIVNDDQIVDIIDRLEAKGWSKERLDQEVISQMPKRLKDRFATEGDNEEQQDTAAEG
jgi:hypothetical protein